VKGNCRRGSFKKKMYHSSRQVMNVKRQNEAHPKSCIIANPIYDVVFKKLMENERIAKFFLGTLLEEQVLSVVIRPQEFTYRKKAKKTGKAEGIGYSVFRIDFMATVETKKGERQKILIEVQKSWDEEDVIRFRNYLAEQYRTVDRINGEEAVLPITTIYILGGKLAGVESPCIKVERTYRDMVEGRSIDVKAPFMEKLTHDSYVIQAKRISSVRYRTKLEALLGLFEQTGFVTEGSEISKQYVNKTGDEDIRFIASVLQEMIADPKEREEIEKEEEALRTLDALFGKTNRKQKQMIEKQAKALEKQAKALEEQARTLEEKDKVLEEKDKALEEQSRQIAELKRLLRKGE
jgi:hypothetical protein